MPINDANQKQPLKAAPFIKGDKTKKIMKHKILISIIVFALLLLGGAALLKREKTETVYNMALKENIAKAAEILNRDKDGDALKDWEEELWKTNPAIPDTDADGTTDGEEIRLRRDPLVPGPNDAFDEKTVQEKINEVPKKPETETERMSREFFAGYLELKQQGGGKISSEALQGLVYDTFLSASLLSEEGKRYGATDIKTEDSGEEALREYGNQIGALIAAHSPSDLPEDPFTIFKRAVETENPDELADLGRYTAEYKGMTEDLLALTVPEKAARIHLELLNAFQGIAENTAALEKIFTDSLKAMPAIAQYQKNAEALATAIKKLQALFIKERIRFNQDESGYLLETIGV